MLALLLIPAAGASAQTGRAPAAAPCAVLNSGGTVFDASECEQLAATGMVVRPAGWTLLAGRSYPWKIVTAPATSTDPGRVAVTGTYADGVGAPPISPDRAMPVALVRVADRSVVARTVTAADGSFRLVVPPNVTGELRLVGFPWTGAAPPAETVVCNGAGECFDYCPLPAIPTTLEPMCADDPGIALFAVRSRPGSGRPR
ncbi:MAG TPA: hypothetical protein VE913_05010 [Longimicrobium sp.]|nr:hypothetical protein [Longimicrobium sp.]